MALASVKMRFKPGLVPSAAALAAAVNAGVASAVAANVPSLPITGPEAGTTQTPLQMAVPSFYLGLGTAYMPRPSGDAASDKAHFETQRDRGTRFFEMQDGTYKTAGILNLRAGQHIKGHGPKKTIWQASQQFPVGADGIFKGILVSDVRVEGLCIDANNLVEADSGLAGTPTYWANLTFVACSNVRVRDVELINFPRYGLSVNAGSDLKYEGGRIIRSLTPKDKNGNPIATTGEGLVAQTQAVLVGCSAGPCSHFVFRDIYANGAAWDTWGDNFLFENCEVENHVFGDGFVVEQYDTSHHHRYIGCTVHGGRGYDTNATPAGAFEIWGHSHLIQGCESYDNDGFAISCGSPNTRVIGNRWRDIGRTARSGGFSTFWVPGASYRSNACTIGVLSVGNKYECDPVNNPNWANTPAVTFSSPGGLNNLNSGVTATFSDEEMNGWALTQLPPNIRWDGRGPLIKGTGGAFSGSPGPVCAPLGLNITGLRRGQHQIAGATFVPSDGTTMPAGLRCFAEVNNDNAATFYLANVNGASTSISAPAGTYSGRILSIN